MVRAQDRGTLTLIGGDLNGMAELGAWLDPEVLRDGNYRARVWARATDGGRDEERTLSDFTVVS